eukprot:CAMPEP_0185253228 /NCGR_PEP_ID=MMETSP1359-20130426/2067_1 /TAXON_ID=552665 /ORGANISM="Bigelowiella longifila, Strain CCMP242" /LENGTH=233 /DNA_ID=CAMNT_0027835573 /DNA_START=60 /DNA_END=761 /DNA_ORIENTATION=-
MQRVQVSAKAFWRDAPIVVCGRKQLRNFVVCDIETPSDPEEKVTAGKYTQGEATVMRDTEAQDDQDSEYISMTHLAHQLSAGDTCAGYDLKSLIVQDDVQSRLRGRDLPEVVIVRKTFPNRKNRARTRRFKLKTLQKEGAEGKGSKRSNNTDKAEDDMEVFMNDLEEDPEMRADVNLYKRKVTSRAEDVKMRGGEEDEDDDGFPEISMDELIEDMGGSLQIGKNSSAPDAFSS